MNNREEIEKILSDPNVNPALKAIAQQKLDIINLTEKSAEGNETATVLLSIANILAAQKSSALPASGVSGISKEEVDKLGFKFSKSKHSDWTEDHGALSLVPKDLNSLPIYTRDAELFVGSLERLEDWLAGVRWAREYDMMLRLSDEKKRGAAEQKERNRQLMRTLKEGKRVEGAVK